MLVDVRTRRSWSWRILLSVALLALAFRIAAPPGYMIDVAPRGLEITLCTAHGSSVTVLDLSDDHQGEAPADDKRTASPCTFAVAPTIAPPAFQASVVALGGSSYVLAAARADASPARAWPAYTHPPATGPPTLI